MEVHRRVHAIVFLLQKLLVLLSRDHPPHTNDGLSSDILCPRRNGGAIEVLVKIGWVEERKILQKGENIVYGIMLCLACTDLDVREVYISQMYLSSQQISIAPQYSANCTIMLLTKDGN